MSELYPIIQKEELPYLTFSNEEVLKGASEIKDRADKLLSAVKQGRLFYKKANLTIGTIDGLKTVHANIWEATDHNVVLMGGITIPVCCIHEVSISAANK